MSSLAGLEQEAESRYSCGDLEGALERYRQVLEQKPGDADVLNRLGRICAGLGLESEGKQYCLRALQAAPAFEGTGEAGRSTAGVEESAGAFGARRAALLNELRVLRPERMLTSWSQVRQVAEGLLSGGDARRAFRLVLGFRSSEPTEESAQFLRERFGNVALKLALAMDEGIGNMIMMTPAIRAIKELFPQSELDVVAKPAALEVLRGWPLVHRLTELDSFDASAPWDAVLYSIWAGKVRKAYGASLSGAGVPIVAVRLRGRNRHEAEFHLDLARLVGYDGPMPEPYCATEEVAFPFEEGRPVALLSDTSSPDPEWDRKRWPRFQELARRLLTMGFQVGLVGGPAEAEGFNPAAWQREVANLMGKYSIAQTAYVIQRAAFLVANDSGPAHIGGAVGAETYVIFGATTELKNLPLGPGVHLLTSDVGCRPCQYLPSWKECTKYACMERIGVAQVVEAIRGRGKPEREAAAPAVQAAAAPLPVAVQSAPAGDGEVRVDLGCGAFKRKGYIGIDVDPRSSADIVCDVRRGIPLETDSVDHLAADNLLEHLGEGLVPLMNEVWRVCKPGGDVEVVVPLFPADKALADPTHCRYFTADTFAYFDSQSALWQSFGASYGIKPFRVVSARRLAGELEVVMTPDKEAKCDQLAGEDDGASKPRVCLVSHNQPGAGGGEHAMHYVANRLVESGYDVTVLHNQTPFIHAVPVETPSDAQYRIGWIHGPDLAAFHEGAARAVAERAGELDVCLSLWKAASPQLVEACNERGILAGIWCQDVSYAPERSNRSILRRADFVVAVTPFARHILERRFGRTKNVFVIPNAASDVYFERYCERTRTEMNRFAFVGRLADRQKGLLTLCEALGRLKQEGMDFTLDVIGTGPDLDLMKSRIGSLGMGERVRFLGWRKAAETAALLVEHDLAILPSNFEACSLALIECMAAGVPVVTTAVGGTPWLVTDRKDGLLVPPGRPDALAGAIKWACSHPLEMNLMARWAHRKALKAFHWERVVRDYRRVLAAVWAAPAMRRRAG